MRKMKRTYVQPTSEVVELHVTNQLLQVSGTEAASGFGEEGPDADKDI